MDLHVTELPPIRSGLQVLSSEQTETGKALLVDKQLQQRIQLGAVLLAAIEAWPSASSIEELADEMGCDASAAHRVVSFFRSRHLLDTPASRNLLESARQAEAWTAMPAAQVPLLIRDDAAFSCTMCGACCSGQNIGPVEPETVEALKPHEQMLQQVTGSNKGFFYSMPIRDASGIEQDTLICQMSDDACVFLGEDRLCTLHGKLGAASKPGVCQVFPYRFVATPEGVAVTIRMECRGFVDARRGLKLQKNEAEIRELLALAPKRSVRPLIELIQKQVISYESYSELEGKLHATVDMHADRPMEALNRLHEQLAHHAGYTRAPLESSQELLGALHELVGLGLQAVDSLKREYTREEAGVVVEISAIDALGHAWVSLFSDLEWVCKPYATEAARSLFSDYAHHYLMAKDLLATSTVVSGLSRMTLGWFLTKALVIHRVRLVKRRHILPQDVMDALTMVNHFFRNHDVQKSLKPLDSRIVHVFHHSLGKLIAEAPGLVPQDPAPEMYKF